MLFVHLILSGGPDYMYIISNPLDVHWRILNNSLSLYNLCIYRVYGLNGVFTIRPAGILGCLGHLQWFTRHQ
jgi:hypothetical protein